MEFHFPDRTERPQLPSQQNNQAGILAPTNSRPATIQAGARIATWQVDKLRPHPSYAELGLTVSLSRLNALLELGEDAFLFPLMVTSNGIVIDAMPAWKQRVCRHVQPLNASNMRFPKRKLSAAFCFVIDHLLDCRLSAASLWHEGSRNHSQRKHFSISKLVAKKRVHQIG